MTPLGSLSVDPQFAQSFTALAVPSLLMQSYDSASICLYILLRWCMDLTNVTCLFFWEVTHRFVGSPHIDTSNIGPFYGLAIGDFPDGTGGIRVEEATNYLTNCLM